jgi:hypothetical protein
MSVKVKSLIIIAIGILLAIGGIKWTIAASSLYMYSYQLPQVIVQENFSLTVVPGVPGVWGSDSPIFPAIMGIVGGLVWVIFGIIFGISGGVFSFPGVICRATGVMLIPIGILNFLASGGVLIDIVKEVQYPSPVLQFLFVYHRKVSILIFIVAAFVLIGIGSLMKVEK